MDSGFITLLKSRQFLPLFLTQFFGAFNDNAVKLSMLTLISYHLSTSMAQSEFYQALAGALFILPFIIFSATAGQLADKYDKALLARLTKVFEVILMIMGSIAIYCGSKLFMMCTLTGLGIHSAFFGPIKYAILPDHLPHRELMRATGLIEASTFLAILFGTTLGTLAIGSTSSSPYLAIFMTILVALAGLIASLFIPNAPSKLEALTIDLNLWQASLAVLRQAQQLEKGLVVILTISWFWLVGAIVLTKLPDYTHFVLGANTTVFALFLALFSIGIALGSLLIGQLLKEQISLTMVPFAMIIFTLFTFDLYWASPTTPPQTELITFFSFFTSLRHWRIIIDFFMLALSAGVFLVPLYTYLQIMSDTAIRARIIAANNIYNALFMVGGSVLVILLLLVKVSISQVFLILSLLNIIPAVGLGINLLSAKRPHALQQ